jgi:hypothetical protein
MTEQVAKAPAEMADHPPAERCRLRITESHESFLREHHLDSVEALFDPGLGTPLGKPGLDAWRERVRLTCCTSDGPKTFYLKRFRAPPVSARRLARRAGVSANTLAGLEWACMRRLAADGIPTARPIALAEEISGRREDRSAILIESVPGRSLEQWAQTWTSPGRTTAAPADIRSLLPMTASLVSRFHARGYVHRDLYLAHIFYDPEAPPEESLHLIDLQRVMMPRWRRRRWIVKDIASLSYSTPTELVSRTDRLRWLKAYLGVRKLDAPAKRFARHVAAKSRRIGRHDHRRGRRFAEGRGSR